MTDLRKAAEMGQPEALRLADVFEFGDAISVVSETLKAAAELRRLHEENQALRQAAKMALEALETDQAQLHWKIVRALRQALAQTKWVGLTDEEMKKTWYEMQNIMGWYSFEEIARLIEAKLKEKNNAA